MLIISLTYHSLQQLYCCYFSWDHLLWEPSFCLESTASFALIFSFSSNERLLIKKLGKKWCSAISQVSANMSAHSYFSMISCKFFADWPMDSYKIIRNLEDMPKKWNMAPNNHITQYVKIYNLSIKWQQNLFKNITSSSITLSTKLPWSLELIPTIKHLIWQLCRYLVIHQRWEHEE